MATIISFDGSGITSLHFRIARAGSKRLVFLYNSAAFDISSGTFELRIKAHARASTNLILLTEGSGLTKGGADDNELTVSFNEEQTDLSENLYYWELFETTTKRTWLSGKAYFYYEANEQITNNSEIEILVDDSTVTVTIESVSSSSSLEITEWVFASNGGAIPTASTAGKVYTTTDAKGSPGDSDHIPANSLMISKVAGANTVSQYIIK